ncbi:glycosyl hydrolase [Pseudomaricurvus alkylphenolicus]|nr:glycosyl hydrolase [Pseudomaricurvus alkylphenolicus]
MTLPEKIGQMCQVNGAGGWVPEDLAEAVRNGQVGSVINEVDAETVASLQKIAVEESRLGIPLLIGRDVIHGFKTIFPIPLGQAASWNPELVEQAAGIAAIEAACAGINWTFSPMIDISRDPRWGRIAESFGEDPHLTSELGTAMVRGYQDNGIGACAKHFAGYGASQSGRDYFTTEIPENELRNVYLEPFRAVAKAGVASFMTGFNDLNGVPASGNEFLLQQVLREEWQYPGMVVSDWESISQLTTHGFTADDREAAFEALNAGVDMEMVSRTYADHLASLLEEGRLSIAKIDAMVANILLTKARLGLFDQTFTASVSEGGKQELALEQARQLAAQSCVLLKNNGQCLPLRPQQLKSLAVIGQLADDGYEQLGTWIFDGDERLSETPLQSIRAHLDGVAEVRYAKALETSRSQDQSGFDDAVSVVEQAQAAVLFLGEESILSGEAHCRADLDLPGCQAALVERLSRIGKPLILVVMAGRPLTLAPVLEQVDAVLYAWHPGSMAGPAISDLLFGLQSPSGKLPVTFPKVVGQIPIFYNHKHGGRPPSPETVVHIDEIPVRAKQTSLGMSAFHLDAGYQPQFPFGFGLSYTRFDYRHLSLSHTEITADQSLTIEVELENSGDVAAEEVSQLYVRDLVGSVTRPVKELKGFQRNRLLPGDVKTLQFTLTPEDLAFYDRKQQRLVEPGRFQIWVGGDSDAELTAEFELK